MSLKDLLSLAPVPALDIAVALLTSTYSNVQNVKVYKQRCQDLSARCVRLVLALREGMHDEESNDYASELEDVLLAIDKRIQVWAEMGRLKSFLQQSDIQQALESFQRDVDSAMMKFQISANLELRKGFNQSRAIQERDKAEIREVLQNIVQSTADMKALLNMNSSQPVEEIMEHLQVELMDPSIPEPQERSFREGLWYLHSRTAKLPPLTELTGQVTKESEHTAFIGTYNDVFRGRWLDREKVALRLPRSLPNKAKIQRRFEREVAVWRQLDHPNVLPLYGIAKLGDYVYSVSPWMDNGTAISYVQEYPQINRLRLLSEVVAGLEYLHFQDIVHGDLRGANVLISEDGVARLSDFGLSQFLGDCGQATTILNNINPRWFAPELIRQTGTFSKESDIWSLSMTFLELLTGEQPFSDTPIDIAVLRLIDNGKTPTRPTKPEHVQNGLNDAMWSLINKCWKHKPDSRPRIKEISQKLAQIRGDLPSTQTNSQKLSSRLSFSFGTKGTRGNRERQGTSESSESISSKGTSTRLSSIIIPTRNGSGDTVARSGRDRPSTSGSSASGGSGRSRTVLGLPNDLAMTENDSISPLYTQTPSSATSRFSPMGMYSRQNSKSAVDARQIEPVGRPIPSPNNSYNARNELLDIPISSSPSSSGNAFPSKYSDRRLLEEDDILAPLTPIKFTPQSAYARRDTARRDTKQSTFLEPTTRPTKIFPSGASPSSSHNSLNENALRLEYQAPPRLEVPHLSSSPPLNGDVHLQPSANSRTRSVDTFAVKPIRSILSTESGTQSSTALKDAILSPELIVYTNGGEVVAGTLEGLIERLINNFNLRRDVEYRDRMLTACIDFVTPEELFAMLSRRFDEAERGQTPSYEQRRPEERVAIQYTIFMVIMYWLSSRHLPVNTVLLWQMKGFCQTAIRLKTSQIMVEKANDLLQLIEDRTEEQLYEETQSTPFDTSPGRTISTAAQILPKDLAIALTLLEGDKFKKIMPCDYLAHQRRQPINGYQNHVENACVVNNRIIQWVKQSILHYDDVKYRADVIKFYINTARECRKFRNYSSLVAIAIALNSAPVERLRLTKNLLSPKMRTWLDEIVALLLPSDNHATYRTALQGDEPESNVFCVPWLALHLKQLHSVLVENPRVVEIDRRHLINFKRYVEFVKVFKDVLDYTAPNLEKHRDEGQLAYLEHQLVDVRVNDSADVELMTRSLALEAGETKLYEHRILERQLLGFATPRKFRGSGK